MGAKKVVNLALHQQEREVECEFVGMINRTIEADPSFVQPMPASLIQKMSTIKQKLDAARARLYQEEM